MSPVLQSVSYTYTGPPTTST